MSIFLVGILLLIQINHPKIIHAHDGKTDSKMCHSDSSVGGYHCHDNISNALKKNKSKSQFLGIKGRDYFHLFASAMTILMVRGDNDPNIDPALTTSEIDLSSDIGYELSYRIGFDFDNPFRTELEYSFWHINLDEATEEPQKAEDPDESYIRSNIPISGYILGHSFSVNMFYTYAPGGNFHSYFGGGAGVSRVVTEVEKGGTDKAVSPHVQGFVGSEYVLNPSKKITLCYKVRAVMNPNMEVFKEAIIKHAVELGLIFYFN